MFNHFCSQVKYTYVTFIFSSIPASGRYIGEISKLSLISVKIPLFNWQIMGPQLKILISAQLSIKSILSNIYSIGYWCEILPLALFCAAIYISCMVKWEISTISLSV